MQQGPAPKINKSSLVILLTFAAIWMFNKPRQNCIAMSGCICNVFPRHRYRLLSPLALKVWELTIRCGSFSHESRSFRARQFRSHIFLCPWISFWRTVETLLEFWNVSLKFLLLFGDRESELVYSLSMRGQL